METRRLWQARFGVGVAMLVLAFIGVVITQIHVEAGWHYWKWIVPVYALLALGLSWYTRRSREAVSLKALSHELLHWVGLILAVALVALFVKLGTLSPLNASLFNLTLLALAVFLAGIYIEATLLAVGLLLGGFAFFAAWTIEYFYAFLIPLLIGGAILVGLISWIQHKRKNPV